MLKIVKDVNREVPDSMPLVNVGDFSLARVIGPSIDFILVLALCNKEGKGDKSN